MYRLNPQQQDLADRAAALADAAIAPYAAEVDAQARFPQEAISALGRDGFLGLTIDPEYGGLGQGLRVAAAVLDQIGQRDASAGLVYLMHLCGVALYGAHPTVAGDPLRAAARGEHLSTLAWSEPGSRSHFWASLGRAVAHDGVVTLTAQKSWVTSAGIAQGYVVSSGAPDAAGPLDTMLYLVLATDPGFTVAGTWDALGMRGNASAPMQLDGTTIPASRALSAPHKGLETMLSVGLPWFALGNSAISVGIAESAVAQTIRHLTGRRFEESGSRLADLPILRARLAEMRIATDRARALLVAALDAVEAGAPTATLLVLQAKAAAGEAAQQVTDLAMTACGGAAFSKHLGLERAFRDARAASVMAPTSDVLHEFIGRALCGMELFG